MPLSHLNCYVTVGNMFFFFVCFFYCCDIVTTSQVNAAEMVLNYFHTSLLYFIMSYYSQHCHINYCSAAGTSTSYSHAHTHTHTSQMCESHILPNYFSYTDFDAVTLKQY